MASYLFATNAGMIPSQSCATNSQFACISSQSAIAISTSNPIRFPLASTPLNGGYAPSVAMRSGSGMPSATDAWVAKVNARAVRMFFIMVTVLIIVVSKLISFYQEPVLGMDSHGSDGGSASPDCNSSMEIPSGLLIKAICPSRGGRWMVMPRSCRRVHNA